MRFKLDENVHPEAAELLKGFGHDVMTVYEQGLCGKDDGTIAEVCHTEGRALVTLDVDFADLRKYPPVDYHGIVVLRLSDQSRAAVLNALNRIAQQFDIDPLVGRLWVVDEHQVRVRDRSG